MRGVGSAVREGPFLLAMVAVQRGVDVVVTMGESAKSKATSGNSSQV